MNIAISIVSFLQLETAIIDISDFPFQSSLKLDFFLNKKLVSMKLSHSLIDKIRY